MKIVLREDRKRSLYRMLDETSANLQVCVCIFFFLSRKYSVIKVLNVKTITHTPTPTLIPIQTSTYTLNATVYSFINILREEYRENSTLFSEISTSMKIKLLSQIW